MVIAEVVGVEFKPLVCPICGVKTRTFGKLRNHVLKEVSKLVAGERKYYCPICDRFFSSVGSLVNHCMWAPDVRHRLIGYVLARRGRIGLNNGVYMKLLEVDHSNHSSKYIPISSVYLKLGLPREKVYVMLRNNRFVYRENGIYITLSSYVNWLIEFAHYHLIEYLGDLKRRLELEKKVLIKFLREYYLRENGGHLKFKLNCLVKKIDKLTEYINTVIGEAEECIMDQGENCGKSL